MQLTPLPKGATRKLKSHEKAGDALDDFLANFPSVSREHAVAVLELAKSALLDKAVASGFSTAPGTMPHAGLPRCQRQGGRGSRRQWLKINQTLVDY